MNLSDFVTPEMVATLVSAVMAILTALAAFAVNQLKLYVASRASANTYGFLKLQAATAVKWLEQSPAFTGAEGAQKKQAAVVSLMHLAEAARIPMTHELADKLVEEAVYDAKTRLRDLAEIQDMALA